MLYKKSHEKFDEEIFRHPPKEYRSAPFWAWNGDISPEELLRQIDIFDQMGFGGFHMHVRTGLSLEYLSPEFMDCIRLCVENAREKGMRAFLYDEDRWPSGSCGGKLTRGENWENSMKSLLFTAFPYDGNSLSDVPTPGSGQFPLRHGNGTLLAAFDVVLNPDGSLRSFAMVPPGQPAEGTLWFAYEEHAQPDPWFNGGTYIDTLRQETVQEFISSTHCKYYSEFGEDFGGVVPSTFTDEPQFLRKSCLKDAFARADLFLPWTDALPREYENMWHEPLLPHLPELFWEMPEGRLSPVRWRFQNTVSSLFVRNYCRQIGGWCRAHNLSLTGHVMDEPTLTSQSGAVGDAMRCYPSFDFPGIDMLCDWHEYTTAVQAASICHQDGKEAMTSELYGVTGWDYDFRGYKLQGDWQAALGVTLRVPHLSWFTMQGESKRDYPASIGYQSPWWSKFSVIEDHFARVNSAMTRGKIVVKIAVLHPIESFWLHFGSVKDTGNIRSEMESQFQCLTETLLFGAIPFDFLCENELMRQVKNPGNPLQIGEMQYDVVLIPPITTIRSSTVDILTSFAENGGKVVFLGTCPMMVDALPSSYCGKLFSLGEKRRFSEEEILDSVEEFRQVEIRDSVGNREKTLLHQLRRESDGEMWLFIANGKNPESPDVDNCGVKQFRIKGLWQPEMMDTLTGEICRISVKYEQGWTVFTRQWHMHDSLLLHLTKESSKEMEKPKAALINPDTFMGEMVFSLDEENMLLLDMAEFSIDGGEFFHREEILRIDNMVRQKLGIPLRRKEVMQPYMLKESAASHNVTLRFRIMSEISLPCVELAMEVPENAGIQWNGNGVIYTDCGYFVDKSIRRISLGALLEGENQLLLTLPIGERTNLECCYLLGNFGVVVRGAEAKIIPMPASLTFGSYVTQGLAFYTGNVTYRMNVLTDGNFTLRIPMYRGALVQVSVDGKIAGNIAFSPYTLHIAASPGEHTLELKLYGNRQNGFGQVHHTPGVYFYQSPNSWRSDGDLWSYEYQLKPVGIMKSPEIYGGRFIEQGKINKCSIQAERVREKS